jgi:NET1-associated nuclear protein 1 (U3 small nucleolar RNA-associated protein 17)
LVLWQLDTGKRQYLPHLGAPIKNIVVSPKGSRYAITLSDNSIMVLSTSEFKAQANIAGIQSLAYSRKAQESNVPCLLHPTISNNLLIATPSNQTDPNATSPYIQTFDTYSDRHVSRQALTRTNATLHNYGPNAAPISEPDITHLAATTDGQWLASVDEWGPSKHDPISSKKREVFLKFWRWSEPRKEWELITRVDAPHPSPDEMGSESILDLATSPEGSAFATLGADGCVKIWKPKTRARPGVPAADSPVNWGCRKSVNFSKRLPVTAEVLPLALLDGESLPKPQGTWGNLAFSSDASLLAVSSPDTSFGAHDSLIHLLDTATGSVRQTLGGFHLGRTTGLAILDRYLVVAATQKVLVWNLVHGKVEWEYVMSEICNLDEPTLHLAADGKDLSFAIAFSSFTKTRTGGNVVVWGPVSDPHPALTQTLSKPVAALKSAGEGKGFFVLDTEARVQYVTPILASHTSVASIVASGQEIEAQEEEGQGLKGLYMTDTKGEVQPMDVDEGIEKVVRREALEGVFDEVEVYEQGSVEAAFERVMALFAKPALGEDDEEEVQLQIEQGDEDEDEDEEMEG